MSAYRYYDAYDRPSPSSVRQSAFPSLTRQQQQSRLPQRPWSPDNYYEVEAYAGDGGAIAQYLARAEQERGGGDPAANVAGRHSDDEYSPRHWQSQRRMAGGPADDGMEMDGGMMGSYHASSSHGHHYNRRQRQEASDISVEALDLADYSGAAYRRPQEPILATFGMRRGSRDVIAHVATDDYNRYPQYASPSRALPDPNDLEDPPSVDRPFSAQSRRSRGTAKSGRTSTGPPPSFVSARERLSSHQSHRSSPRSAPKGLKTSFPSRHTSLPPPVSPTYGASDPNGPDVRTFPKWSQGWYDSTSPHPAAPPYPPPNPYYETDLGVWPPQAAGGVPTHPRFEMNDAGNSTFLPWGHSATPAGHTLQMSDPPQYVPEAVREERMRMLEKEFGGKGKGKELVDPEGMIGSVDAEGTLITDGPKARSTVRTMQCLLALAAAVSGIYGALMIHPKTPAPPASTLPAYVLYAFSVVSFLFSVYFFCIRPCLYRRKRRKAPLTGQPGAPGMMVLPVMQGLGGKGKGKGAQNGKKKKKGMPGPGEGVQVNLIVDPSMFGGGGGNQQQDDDEDEDEDDFQGGTPSKRRDKPKRRSVFEAMALERSWKSARRRLKWQFAVDVLFMILWGGVFFFVLWGKRCPSGSSNGWCDTYNVSTACACLLCVSFGFGIYYDIKDMSASKLSPRTRT